MIVLPQADDKLLVVRQLDHVRASHRIASAWRKPCSMSESLWSRFLDAIACHDDGWIQAEKNPGVNADGKPFDFLDLPIDAHIGVWRDSIELAAGKDIYHALLITRHARWLYKNFPRDDSPADLQKANAFVTELNEAAACFRAALSNSANSQDIAAVEPETLDLTGWLFGFFDYISLALLEALPLKTRTEPLVFDGQRAEISLEREDHRVVFDPWPLDCETLELEIPVIDVEGTGFDNTEVFQAAIDQGRHVERKFVLCRDCQSL